MTIPGRDSSAFLPDDAGLRQAYADGIRFWAGYFAGPGIWVGWPDSNFLRIKAAGMQSLAFCSGGSDPVACRTRADRLGILFGPDVEANITDGGQPWLDAAGTAGVYGGAAVMTRRAAWHIVADYRAIPGDTWPSYLARPAGPLGWQYQGTHSEYGGSVDSSRLDDFFAGGTQPQGGFMALSDVQQQQVYDWMRELQQAFFSNVPAGNFSLAQTYLDMLGALKAQVAAMPPGTGGGGVDPNTQKILDKVTAIETALKGA